MLQYTEAAILLCLIFCLYVYWKRKFNYWAQRGVLHRKVIIPFGHLLEIIFSKESYAKYFLKLYDEFEAPYIGFYALTKPYLLIKDPDLIKKVLAQDFNVFPNRNLYSNKKIDTVLSNSLIGLQGSEWKELRKKLTPVFSSGNLKLLEPLMVECGKNLEVYLSGKLNRSIEIKDTCAKFSMNVIATCAFGLNLNSLEDDSEFLNYSKLIIPVTKLQILKSATYIFAPIFVKMFKYPFIDACLTEFFRKVFMKTLKNRELRKNKRDDLIDVFNKIKDDESNEDTEKFDSEVMFAQVLFFFIAGHDSVSSIIAFTLHELAVNNNIQERLRDEILKETKKSGGVTYESAQKMVYLDMVIYETLRKYVLAPAITRKCVETYKFDKYGLVLEKGTGVLISQMGLHYDPRYFPNPEKFDQERFNEINKRNIPNYVYLPFGGGPRSCIGEKFGLLASKFGIAYIIKNFKANMNSETREPLIFARSSFLQSKYGINLTLTKL